MAASKSLSPASDPSSSLASRLPPSPPLSPSLKALQMSPISDGAPSSLFLPAALLACEDPMPSMADPFELWLTDPDSAPASPAPASRPPPPPPIDTMLSCLGVGTPQQAPPEPDAMLPIYAALGDFIDVDSESMAFHQEEESQPAPMPAVLPSPVSIVPAADLHPAKPDNDHVDKMEGKTIASGKRKKGEKRQPKRADRKKVGKAASASASAASPLTGLSTGSSSGGEHRGGKRGASGHARGADAEENGGENGRVRWKRKRTSAGVVGGAVGETGAVRNSVGGKTGAGRRSEGGKRVARAASPDGDERNMPVREKCIRCQTTASNTPMMRKGPDGCRSLCNACGLKWSRHGIY